MHVCHTTYNSYDIYFVFLLLFQIKELKSGEVIKCGAKDRFKRRKKFAPLATIGKSTEETQPLPKSRSSSMPFLFDAEAGDANEVVNFRGAKKYFDDVNWRLQIPEISRSKSTGDVEDIPMFKENRDKLRMSPLAGIRKLIMKKRGKSPTKSRSSESLTQFPFKNENEFSKSLGSTFSFDSFSSEEDDLSYDEKFTFQRGTLSRTGIKGVPSMIVSKQMHGCEIVLQNVNDKTISPNASTNSRKKSSDEQEHKIPVIYVQEDVNGNDVIKRERIIPPPPSYPPPPLPDHVLEAIKNKS